PSHIDLVFNGPVRLIKFELMGTGHEMPTKFAANTEAAAEFHIETPGMHPGEFTVNWAVIGADGHTITNSFGFVVDPAAPETASN
ncbi:MAG: copper resistance protein CopC, partial [Gammaproteobacteria bacterium]